MKNMTNVKFRTFLTILIGINMIFLPFSIHLYLANQMSVFPILQSAVNGIFITLAISYLLNEQIFKIIFYHMLKGKRIQNEKQGIFDYYFSHIDVSCLYSLVLTNSNARLRLSYFYYDFTCTSVD